MSFPTTLATATPEEGFAMVIKLARLAVKFAQPDDAVRARIRPRYAEEAGFLIASSHVVATHCQTIAQANAYWIPGEQLVPRAEGGRS